MKTIWNIIRWMIGLILLLASFTSLIETNFMLALGLLLLGLLFIPPICKFLFNKKKTKEQPIINKTQSNDNKQNIDKTITINKANEINLDIIDEYVRNKINQNVNQSYSPLEIQTRSIQSLESIYILNSTKNLDTLVGRYQFILEIYDSLINASSNNRYLSDIQFSIDHYKTMYYDRILEEIEIKLVVQPNNYELKNFFTDCLFACFNRFYRVQISEIQSLKRKDAIQKRKDKIIEIAKQLLFEFDKNNCDNKLYKSDLTGIKNLLNELNKKLID